MPDSKKQIDLLVNDLWAQLHANAHALENNLDFDIEGIEEKVKSICTLVTNLPKEEAISFEPELTKIIDFLTDISSRMQQQQIKLRENTHQRALDTNNQTTGLKSTQANNPNDE
jgi:hypothetical protein